MISYVGPCLLFLNLVYNAQALCSDDVSFEYPNAYTFTDSVDTETTPTGYLLEPSDYHVPDTCTCGVIKQWQFYASGSGAIRLQVWRRLQSNSYILIGENYFTVPASAINKKIEYLVPLKYRITVRNGDLIGWFTGANVNVVAYTRGPQDAVNSPVDEYPDGVKKQSGMSDTTIGATFDWNSGAVTIFEDTVYAFGATLLSNTAPEFTNLDHKVIIYPSWVAGSVVYTVSVDDLESADLDTLQVTMDDDVTGYFQFDRSTYDVSLVTPFPTETSVDTVLTFTVSDQCGNSGFGTLSIEVRNQFPQITNLPQFTTISEETTKQVLLATVAITDDDDSNLTPTLNINPDPGFISIRSEGTDNSRSIYSDASAIYSYLSDQIYVMDVTVSDGTDVSNTGYALLYITKNDPPKITNLGQSAHLNTSFVSTVKGETLFTIEATDEESDPLTYTITCDPSPCPIDTNPKDGVIKTTEDFQGSYEPGYDLVITVEDETTVIDTKTLTILVQEITYRPTITNLPLDNSILISEGTALGTVIYSLSYIDLDTNEDHTIYAELDPGWAWNYFSLNSTSGVLTTAHRVIDYEFLASNTATLTITVTDSFGPTSGTVALEFGNVNEAPSFSQTKYTLEPAESAVQGTNAGDPHFEISDPDNGDTHYYSWDCGDMSRYFALDINTAAITYALDFDLDDVDITVPFTCTVTVTDAGGLTGTTLLEIDIHDDNDNAPKFSQTVHYVIFAEPTLSSGRLVGQIPATDADYSSDNNFIYYTIDDFNNLFGEEFIYINNYGNIYVNVSWTSPTFEYGKIITFGVTAQNKVDSSQTRQSATTTVSLVMAAIPETPIVTTDRPVDFIGDTRNVAWLSIALVLGSVVLITLCFYALYYTVSTKRYRWCCPVCRRHLLGLTKVMKRKKIDRYKNILKREEEGWSSSSSSSENSSSSSDSSDTDSEADTLPKPKVFKPWERGSNADTKSADSKNFKPWTRSQKL